jgi:hypothetical protein
MDNIKKKAKLGRELGVNGLGERRRAMGWHRRSYLVGLALGTPQHAPSINKSVGKSQLHGYFITQSISHVLRVAPECSLGSHSTCIRSIVFPCIALFCYLDSEIFWTCSIVILLCASFILAQHALIVTGIREIGVWGQCGICRPFRWAPCPSFKGWIMHYAIFARSTRRIPTQNVSLCQTGGKPLGV